MKGNNVREGNHLRLSPRFSLRTLAIVVTLVCAYFGAWEATKRYGCPQFGHIFGKNLIGTSSLPFIIGVDEYDYRFYTKRRLYFVWLFGPTCRLPLDSQSPIPNYPAKSASSP